MGHTACVQIVHPRCQLIEVFAGIVFGHTVVGFNAIEQFATGGILQKYELYVALATRSEISQNVLVVQHFLDAHLFFHGAGCVWMLF